MPDDDVAQRDERGSRRLAWLLRHRPDGLESGLTRGGWAVISEVLAALDIDRAALERAVAAGGERYEVTGGRIRARHGHSVDVTLDHPVLPPPDELFHGTVERALASIRAEGLRRGARQSVHLARSREHALAVGGRRGAPVCITVRAAMAHAAGLRFARVGDGTIWLVEHVPPAFLMLP